MLIKVSEKQMELKELQSHFQSYLMHGTSHQILPEIVPDKRFSAQNRLNVYYNAYYLRLLEILRFDFPKTLVLMGDEDFDKAFSEYIAQYPSTHFSVRYFGQHFSQFLAQQSPYKDFPVLSEMAQFEWDLGFTLDAADGNIVKVTDLSTLSADSWPHLRFTFHPSVISRYYAWDTAMLWRHIEEELPPRPPVKQENPIRWMFWRKDLRCYFQSCTEVEDVMYQAIVAGKNFGEICESLIEILPEEAISQNAAQVLHKWITQDMITKLVSLKANF